MTALLIRRRRPIGEPSGPDKTAWDFASTLEGTRGAGRVCVALTQLGVSLPDEQARLTFLRAAARHVAGEGQLIVEHHPIDWAETAEATTPTPGADLGMDDVRRHPPFVSAVSTFDFGGQYVRQPFTARVLSDPELDATLAVSGLARSRRLGPTWLEARAAVPAA